MNLNKNILEMIEYPKQGVLSKEILREEKIDCTLFCMASGTEISEHTSTKQGIVYVIEGKGVFNLQGKNIEIKEGIFIYMKENAVHSLKAEENTSFLLVLTDKSEWKR
jgi:nitric oxide dioxygenase